MIVNVSLETCDSNVALSYTEGSYTYGVELAPGEVVEIVCLVNVGKIALKFDPLYRI